MKLKKKFVSVLLTALISFIPAVSELSAGGQEKKYIYIPVVDGIFHHVDMENRMIYVAIDKEGKIIREIPLVLVESVYLIQGRPERLKEFLVGGAIGGTAGLSAPFLVRLVRKSLSKDQNQKEIRLSFAGIILATGGGIGAGFLANYFKNKGEDDATYFPVYDPSIKQKNPNSSIDFGDRNNIKNKLIEKESFVHLTLKMR